MPDLLLELGCEELPASFVRKAYNDLFRLIAERLQEAGIPFEPGEGPMGTPRRLIVHYKSVANAQPSRTEEKRGPGEAAAFDAQGSPTPALLGFCRGMGAEVKEVRREGGYVWATKLTPGRPTIEVLSETLPEAIRAMTFEKAMRWGSARLRFARPVRWILASFDGKAVPFEIEGVKAGLKSRGHRFDAAAEFEAKTIQELVSGLRERNVEPNPKKRRERIATDAKAVATGDPVLEEALVEENVFLTEWPRALQGSFKVEYLELPAPVLITAMAKHERFFPVLGKDGRLTNQFVSIWNGGEEETVRQGNEWVLNARFNDAKFFFDEDKKHTLDEFLEKTSGIVFQEKLGTIRQRADRLSKLAAQVAELTGADADQKAQAAQAGLFCKADLSTGLVSELASLQGVVGGEYARREGFPEPVCWAIASHYDLAKNPKIECEGARAAVRTLIADQVDKLVGYLGLGLAPSGSSDLFGLRRAATMLIEAAWNWPTNVSFYSPQHVIRFAIDLYRDQGLDFDRDRVVASFATLFLSRYESLLPEVRSDFLDASAAWSLYPREVRFRLDVLNRLAGDREFIQTATRPINIVNAAVEKGLFERSERPDEPARGELASPDGETLLSLVLENMPKLHKAAGAEDPGGIVGLLKQFEVPINRFFDSTMVMVDDESTRNARLNMLDEVCKALSYGGDFSKVVVEGI